MLSKAARTGFGMLCLAVAVVSGPAMPPGLAREKPKQQEEGHGKPRLKLAADPAVGFEPLTTHLTAVLTGIAPDDANFCHPAVTWVRVDPGQTEDSAARYHEDSVCRHPPEESAATTTFTRNVDLYQFGSYLFKLIVEGKDHTRVESSYTRVEVLRVQ